MSFISYIEKHLGPIARGWAASSEPGAIQVCLFEDQPSAGAKTLMTLGLSRHVLEMKSGRQVRQELMLAFHGAFDTEALALLLLHMAENIETQHHAVLRGEVIHLGTPVTKGALARDLYVSMPDIFPDALATFEGSVPPTVVVWLFPVCSPEVNCIERFGWNYFEDLLERSETDLLDFRRQSMAC